uniref:C-type lectin domain-containing protein n=1 Tax=Amphilophus citrinellus TaxID=61819 RepID=A0A3Q0SRV7_AMPCI
NSVMIFLLFLFGLALGAESPSDDKELLRGNCPLFWYSFNGCCYKYVATHMTWADAEFYCLSEGANLVSVHNKVQDDFIKSLIRNFDHAGGPTWIGLSDIHREGRWMWSDGSAVRFAYWNTGEPNNSGGREHCVLNNYGTAKKWGDYSCSYSYPSVCAKCRVCN